MGGAAWTVSRHTKNPKLAVEFVTFVTTNADLWKGIPISRPTSHLAFVASSVSSKPLFANDPFPVFQAAADSDLGIGQLAPV